MYGISCVTPEGSPNTPPPTIITFWHSGSPNTLQTRIIQRIFNQSGNPVYFHPKNYDIYRVSIHVSFTIYFLRLPPTQRVFRAYGNVRYVCLFLTSTTNLIKINTIYEIHILYLHKKALICLEYELISTFCDYFFNYLCDVSCSVYCVIRCIELERED